MHIVIVEDCTINAEGLKCPMPLLKAKLGLASIHAGEVLIITATDVGSYRDIPAYLSNTSHELIESTMSDGIYRYVIRKGS